jgi:hypothetical protein
MEGLQTGSIELLPRIKLTSGCKFKKRLFMDLLFLMTMVATESDALLLVFYYSGNDNTALKKVC